MALKVIPLSAFSFLSIRDEQLLPPHSPATVMLSLTHSRPRNTGPNDPGPNSLKPRAKIKMASFKLFMSRISSQ